MTDPYVLLALARSRAGWFSELSRWSSSGAAPVELVKCLTPEEVRAVLGSGRQVSALLVGAGTPGADRDLIGDAALAGAVTFVVRDGRVHRDWDSLGCAAVVDAAVSGEEVLQLLEQHARPVRRDVRRATSMQVADEPPRSFVLGVTGAGGSGASTVAMATAQALVRGTTAGAVALVDGCRRGDLAMYHDVGDVVPGLPELVEAHRVDHPDPEVVRSLLHRSASRGYEVLAGMRSARDWVAMRPRSLDAAIEGLERSYEVVVVDHEPDLEGESATGSMGVEDRHGVARAVARRADLVLVVATAGLKGTSDLLRYVAEVAAEGVPGPRILPVVTRCPRSPATRSSITRALAELAGPAVSCQPPVFLPKVRGLESVHHSERRLPEALVAPLGRAVRRVLLESGARSRQRDDAHEAIRPGDLGTHLDTAVAGGRTLGESDAA